MRFDDELRCRRWCCRLERCVEAADRNVERRKVDDVRIAGTPREISHRDGDQSRERPMRVGRSLCGVRQWRVRHHRIERDAVEWTNVALCLGRQ